MSSGWSPSSGVEESSPTNPLSPPSIAVNQHHLQPTSISAMHSKRAVQAPRRPRASPSAHHTSTIQSLPYQPAYAVPAPVLLAVATLSLAALRRLFSASPVSLRTLTNTLRQNMRALFPRRQASPPPSQPLRSDPAMQLDALRDRSIAEIDALQPGTVDYSSLAPVQRRALLASALQRAYCAPVPRRRQRVRDVTVQEVEQVAQKGGGDGGKFWNAVEKFNGRVAAIGFLLCLTREVVEPGHPSLFEQVVDVVVPIAQKTPPFLVAVVDRLVDLVT